jgi:hypothetical protein
MNIFIPFFVLFVKKSITLHLESSCVIYKYMCDAPLFEAFCGLKK